MGVLKLFLHHHRRRPPVEGDGPCLSAADDRRSCTGLPRQIPVGTHSYGYIRGVRGERQPRTDDVLLPVRYPVHGDSLPRRRRKAEAPRPLRQGHGRMRRRRADRHLPQPEQPLPYVGIQQGVDARQERARKEAHRQPDGERARPRLHTPMELRHRRDVDPARAQHEGRSQRAARRKRDGHEARRQPVSADLPADRPVLGRAAGHARARLRRRIRADAVRARPVHSERAYEVGALGGHGAVGIAVVGQELHALHQLLHRWRRYSS